MRKTLREYRKLLADIERLEYMEVVINRINGYIDYLENSSLHRRNTADALFILKRITEPVSKITPIKRGRPRKE